MDILQLYKDYGIPHETEGHKHCRPGWVNTACPFCTGNPGLHLGATLDGRSFVCWRCGFKPVRKALGKLLQVNEDQVREITLKYGGITSRAEQKKIKIRKKGFQYPTGTTELSARHIKYLKKRGYDPDRLVELWGLQATGPMSLLDKINYKQRILAPIIWDSKPVSFQARDITGRHPLKYLACPEDRELIKHKEILYGRQQDWARVGICVEGITDVWRFGPSSFATFGIKFTRKQVRLIAKQFEKIFIVYDDDPQAKTQARRLKGELDPLMDQPAEIIDIQGDPGDLTQLEADYLLKQLLK